MITRFAPSPTGYLHFGNIRTALFNWLAAKHAGGTMQLRIEDTDKARSETRFVDAIVEDLAWLGLNWTGDDKGVAWRQSERHAAYLQAFDNLRQNGHLYPCFCTPEDLTAQRIAQRASGKPPKYDGTCAALSAATASQRLQNDTPAVWRFHMPTAPICYTDIVRGVLTFPADTLGDFIIRRANGDFSFLFVNALDDSLCGVSTVLRGEDHIANTPRQLALAAALKLNIPAYGHITLLVNDSGKPLSKRDGLTPVRDWRQRGFLPLAIVNYLARVGHTYPPDIDDGLLSADELATHFSLSRLGRSAAKYDESHLRQRQKAAVLGLSDDAFGAWLGDDTLTDIADKAAFCRLIRDNTLLPEDATAWRQAFFADPPPFSDAAKNIVANTPAAFYQAAAEAATLPDWQTFIQQVRQMTEKSGKLLFLPLRAALTGRDDGPVMPAVFSHLSADRRRQRLSAAARIGLK